MHPSSTFLSSTPAEDVSTAEQPTRPLKDVFAPLEGVTTGTCPGCPRIGITGVGVFYGLSSRRLAFERAVERSIPISDRVSGTAAINSRFQSPEGARSSQPAQAHDVPQVWP